LARKLAHEIKNPLTPIQLTIDRLKNKYSEQLETNEQTKFKDNLKIINNQIKQIEKLVNEFSDFARMPKPTFQKNNLSKLLNENIRLLNELDRSIEIIFLNKTMDIMLHCDKEQISRVFFNLIKNSIESIHQKTEKDSNSDKKITIELIEENDHINFVIHDTGIGFNNLQSNIKDILSPYFTTKKEGTGLGLSIVNKIVNDHNGNIKFVSVDDGAKIQIFFKK
jgi:two-component system nitrogen regulation sensor histidine kinase NtrY